MTFNEGMQIDTSTASSSGGGGMGRIAIGGGIGGLLVVVVALRGAQHVDGLSAAGARLRATSAAG